MGDEPQTFIETKVGEALGIPAEPERKPSAPGPATAHAAPLAEGTHAASSLSQLDESGVTQREITREELDAYRPKEEGGLEDASPVDASTIAGETGKLASDLKPSAATIANNAGNALREYFKSGSTSSFDELAAKLGEAWGAAEKLISAQGAKLAREAVAVLLGKGGDYAVGEKVGWLAGMIVVEVVIALLTAGTGTAAKGAATAAKAAGVAAKPVRWTKRAFDAMVSAFRTAGRWLKDAAKSLEKLAQRAKGALQRVMEAIREAGRSIVEFVERLIGRVRGAHAPRAPHASHVPHTPYATTPHPTTPHAPKEPHSPAGTRAERDVSVKETGHVESNQPSQKQIDNELQHIADNPHVVEGTPPNRTAKIGEHTWVEQEGGGWCRHSNGEKCVLKDGVPDELKGPDAALAPKEPAPGAPGSSEHKAARWKEYVDAGGEWPYERWSNVYEANMQRATKAHEVADAYHKQLGWGKREATVDVEGVPRRLDIADAATQKGVEVKSGYQYASQDNLWELQRDAILVEQGWSITWYFDGPVSKPLLKALDDANIPYILKGGSVL